MLKNVKQKITDTTTDLINNLKTDGEFLTYVIKVIVFFFMIIVVSFIYLNVNFKDAFTGNSNVLIIIIVILLTLIFITKDFLYVIFFKRMYYTIVTLLIIMFSLYFFSKYYSQILFMSVDLQVYIQWLIVTLFVISIIVALAIFFFMFSDYIRSLEGFPGIIVYFIFYIPCALIDFVMYIINEVRMTSRIVYILLFIEVIIILIYLYLPQIISTLVSKQNKKILLNDTVFLDKKLIIGTSDVLKVHKNKQRLLIESQAPESVMVNFTKNYSVSLWLYLNTQPVNASSHDTESNIFSYNSKPAIMYLNSTNNKSESQIDKDLIVIYFSNNNPDTARFELELERQRWHNIVFNYIGTTANVFINGKLERSIEFTDNNFPRYSPSDQFIVGSNNYLYGAVCNIYVTSNTMLPSEIARNYNMLMYKNPPIFK